MVRLIVAVLLMVSVALAAGEYFQDAGTLSAVVTTDGAGDSTFASGTFSVANTQGFRTLQFKAKLDDAVPAYGGLGKSDSGWLWLYSVLGSERVLIDSAVSAGLPCSLLVNLHSNVGDTLLRNLLDLDWQVYDSLGDSSFDATYPVRFNLKLK